MFKNKIALRRHLAIRGPSEKHEKLSKKLQPTFLQVGCFHIRECYSGQYQMKAQHIHGMVEDGQNGLLIDIECQLTKGLPGIIFVGYATKAVDEAKERIRNAFASSNLTLPAKRITINLAPADIPKDSTGFGLAIAASILVTSKQAITLNDTAIIGEFGLDGAVRPVRGIIGKPLPLWPLWH